MKVRVVVVADVDPEKWKKVFELDEGMKPRQVQNEVRQYVETGVVEKLGTLELFQAAGGKIEAKRE